MIEEKHEKNKLKFIENPSKILEQELCEYLFQFRALIKAFYFQSDIKYRQLIIKKKKRGAEIYDWTMREKEKEIYNWYTGIDIPPANYLYRLISKVSLFLPPETAQPLINALETMAEKKIDEVAGNLASKFKGYKTFSDYYLSPIAIDTETVIKSLPLSLQQVYLDLIQSLAEELFKKHLIEGISQETLLEFLKQGNFQPIQTPLEFSYLSSSVEVKTVASPLPTEIKEVFLCKMLVLAAELEYRYRFENKSEKDLIDFVKQKNFSEIFQ